ncbi:hypothetical protein BDV23DRAFT_177291 [Aspergillus alliaceus]|uniref:DUF7730 domain-containing protein n=1 Tax=Petromyces alliaceus TaxID=209559 RepID=A0A5N7BQK1_PETAA|nr:hypothetical protein BDV23DRAFT_177291 [Aspergillus alliaceus]
MSASLFFRRLFHRNPHDVQSTHPPPISAPGSPPINSIPNWSRAVFESIENDILSDQSDGSRTDPSCLPRLPSDYRCLSSTLSDNASSPPVNIHPQSQSPFFSLLPPEIRHLIYLFAFGNRRIHLDFDFNLQLGRWTWWHRICDDAQNCPDKPFPCPEHAGAEEAMLKLASSSWVKENFEYKLDAVNWFRCCRRGYQESFQILYTSNTLVLTHGIDQVFRLSRVMPREYLALISSLSVEIDIYRVCREPPRMEARFKSFYDALFEILLCELAHVRDLRFSIAGLPCQAERLVGWQSVDVLSWIAPWDALALSRDWRRLEIALPRTWVANFEEVVERRSVVEQGKRYKIVVGSDICPRGW